MYSEKESMEIYLDTQIRYLEGVLKANERFKDDNIPSMCNFEGRLEAYKSCKEKLSEGMEALCGYVNEVLAHESAVTTDNKAIGFSDAMIDVGALFGDEFQIRSI